MYNCVHVLSQSNSSNTVLLLLEHPDYQHLHLLFRPIITDTRFHLPSKLSSPAGIYHQTDTISIVKKSNSHFSILNQSTGW